MFIKNNRLYDEGISFEIPKDVRINIDHGDKLAFLRDDEIWYLSVDVWPGRCDEKEIREFIADLVDNNDVAYLQTCEMTINDVFIRQVNYEFAGSSTESVCTCFLNMRNKYGYWSHFRVWGSVCEKYLSSGKTLMDHPVIGAFIKSVRKEPEEKHQDMPPCVLEMREQQRMASAEESV